jgi:hypothetical protein
VRDVDVPFRCLLETLEEAKIRELHIERTWAAYLKVRRTFVPLPAARRVEETIVQVTLGEKRM